MQKATFWVTLAMLISLVGMLVWTAVQQQQLYSHIAHWQFTAASVALAVLSRHMVHELISSLVFAVIGSSLLKLVLNGFDTPLPLNTTAGYYLFFFVTYLCVIYQIIKQGRATKPTE